VAGALILCLPAFVNGQPILYPDTIDYLQDGESLVRFTWPTNRRPVFYGLGIWFLHWERAIWPVVLVQGLVVSHLIWLTLRAIGVMLRPMALLGIFLALAIATPLAWYMSHIMPDVFLGVLVLAMFLLGFCRDQLGKGEVVYLFLLAAASICFHLSYLPLALVIAAITAASWLLYREGRALVRPLLVAGPVLLALTALFSFSLVVYKEVTLTPKSPPFLLARMLADGPSKAYLRATCGHTPYLVCNFLDEIPNIENTILWSFPPFGIAGSLYPENAVVIRAEAGSIVAGTIWMFPGWIARNMVNATARQLVTIASGNEFEAEHREVMRKYHPYAGPNYPDSLQGRGLLNEENLAGMNLLHGAAVAAGLPLAILLAIVCARRRVFRPLILFGLIAVALLVNAFVTGALAGVFGRYQGRGIWLLPFFVIAAGFALRSWTSNYRYPGPAGSAMAVSSVPGQGS
jgi:hypothetical protein